MLKVFRFLVEGFFFLGESLKGGRDFCYSALDFGGFAGGGSEF